MKADLKPLPPKSYIMRIGGDDWEYGLPYEISLVVVDLGEAKCEIMGLDKPINRNIYLAIKNCLLNVGFKECIGERRVGDRVYLKKFI